MAHDHPHGYVAVLANTHEVTPGGYCYVSVCRTDAHGDQEGEDVLSLETDIPLDEEDGAAQQRAVDLLDAHGWSCVGEWEAEDFAYTIIARPGR